MTKAASKRQVHRWPSVIGVGLVSLIVGGLQLVHPHAAAFSPVYGHRADLAGVAGVALVVLGLVCVGLAAREAWFHIQLRLTARS